MVADCSHHPLDEDYDLSSPSYEPRGIPRAGYAFSLLAFGSYAGAGFTLAVADGVDDRPDNEHCQSR